MVAARPAHLHPRKTPRQARATATLDAIFEATIQLLVADGPRRVTTTHVAARAGVSVGTMYQYVPHKQALFYAVNERYLDRVASRIEVAAQAQRGVTIAEMVDALVGTYWAVKMERPEVTRALYRSVVEIDNEVLIEGFAARVDAATAAMLASASDASFAELPLVTLTLLSTIFGTIRNVFERNLTPEAAAAVEPQLKILCRAYLGAIKIER